MRPRTGKGFSSPTLVTPARSWAVHAPKMVFKKSFQFGEVGLQRGLREAHVKTDIPTIAAHGLDRDSIRGFRDYQPWLFHRKQLSPVTLPFTRLSSGTIRGSSKYLPHMGSPKNMISRTSQGLRWIRQIGKS